METSRKVKVERLKQIELPIENCQTDMGVPQAAQGSGFTGLRFAPVPMKTCETSKHTVIK
ncbi:hypothetical protein ASU31_07580 [Pedobacter ginsenosidimutans]|uniref:Uncharacterized protein n=1 Tax=Pedobacter ginsenosidimutans TaxID=687842 RepID=A0A0T5VS27_9SPHI|nr:hypothetical protein ASU31_07580 [Pedobacter ginsenosidimutans]